MWGQPKGVLAGRMGAMSRYVGFVMVVGRDRDGTYLCGFCCGYECLLGAE